MSVFGEVAEHLRRTACDLETMGRDCHVVPAGGVDIHTAAIRLRAEFPDRYFTISLEISHHPGQTPSVEWKIYVDDSGDKNFFKGATLQEAVDKAITTLKPPETIPTEEALAAAKEALAPLEPMPY